MVSGRVSGLLVGACVKGAFPLRSWLSDDRNERRSPMQGYAAEPDGAFTESRECFAELEEGRASEDAAGLQHGELEEQLEVRGRELLRRLFQDRLDLTAARRRGGMT